LIFSLTPLCFARQNSGSDRNQDKGSPVMQQSQDEANPPEEDESVAPEKFVLDPLESERNVKIGDFYWHKGDYIGAKNRYERATKFNPNSAEAFLKLGKAEEKLHNPEAAKAALQKALQLAPKDSKIAREAKKELAKTS
jgi:tetratricopeptide (TPR) repeat protein